MNNGYKEFGLLAIIVCWVLVSCNNVHRINKILQKHPELIDSFTKSEILVRNQQVHDTLLYFKSDTIITEYATIYRTSDTIRLITRERPCTTYVHNTEIKPQAEKPKKERKGTIHETLNLVRDIALLFLAGLFLLFAIKLLRR